jgi:hypothetical protein
MASSEVVIPGRFDSLLLPLAVLVLLPATAAADPADIGWVRAAGAERCPDAEALRDEVGRRLGRAPDPAPNAIEVVASRAAPRWAATVYLRGPTGDLLGERTLEALGDDCSQLVEATSLVVALMIDPEAALRPPAPANTPPIAARRERPARRPAARPATRVEVSLGVAGALGVLPSAAVGVSLDAHLPLSSRWGVALGVRWLPEVSDPSAAIGLGWTALRAGPCWTPLSTAPFALRLCADVRAGAMRSTLRAATNLVADQVGERPWVGAALTVAARAWAWRGLFVGVDLEAQSPFVRDAFVVVRPGGTTTLFQQSPVTAVGVVSVGASI